MKILCGMNFDPGSDAAGRFAVDLAARMDGSVELLHVVPPMDLSPLCRGGKLHAERTAMEREAAEKSLAAVRDSLRAESSIPVTIRVETGHPDACLLLRAAELPADLIALGMSGSSRTERWLLGSVSEPVARLSDCAVLLVPPDPSGRRALGSGAQGLNILVAIDERRDSGGALEFVRRFRARGLCDIVALRLYWPIEEYRRLGLTTARDLSEADLEVVKDLELSVRRRVGELGGVGKFEIAVEPCEGDLAQAIVAAGRARGCDLIVMGAESRSGLARLAHPAVADRVAHLAPDVPVLFVPHHPAVARPATAIVTVLAATDCSEDGDRAVRAAYGLLSDRGGVIELCHVHERPLAAPVHSYDEPAERLSRAQRVALEGRLRALIPADVAGGVTTRVNVIDGGQAATALVQAAERLRVDAVVLGAGRGGLARRALLGSVAQTVACTSRRPVMLIPNPGRQKP